jgi:hypothetical protein
VPHDFDVDDLALTSVERMLLAALNDRGVHYLLIGPGAAVLQGERISPSVMITTHVL